MKPEYSKLQYHWCPAAFSVNTGLCTSSIKFNNRRDGIAVSTRMIAGAIVQIVSIICPSRMNCLVCLLWIILIIMYITVVIIINIIIKAWSLKKINFSMIGDALSCSLGSVMLSFLVTMKVLTLRLWCLNQMHLSATLELY